MTAEQTPAGKRPAPDEAQAALARMFASEEFRGSPQLIRLLRFVADAVLDGKGGRITSYAIGVDALARGEHFDPQTDPIVRVEATRLRRAMERYYAGTGAQDPVLIQLPRGGYVPSFEMRAPVDDGPSLRGGVRYWLAGVVRRQWAIAGIVAILAVGGVGIASGLRLRVPTFGADSTASAAPAAVRNHGALRPGNGMPSLVVRIFDVAGPAPPAAAIAATGLREKLTDALSRFDAINVHLAHQASRPTDHAAGYQLFGFLEYAEDGTVNVRFRLIDAAVDKVVWARSFEPVAPSGNHDAAEDAMVQQLASTLLQGFGVIRTYEFAKIGAMGEGEANTDPRYRCLLVTFDAFRSFNSRGHDRARSCLEELTSADTNFSVGYAYLSFLYIREYLFGLGTQVDDSTALDRALQVARRSVETSPSSARAYHGLACTLIYRHDFANAIAAFEKAITLNPYDVVIASAYGNALIQAGDIDRGMSMMKDVGGHALVRPIWEHFNLFLGYYMRGDVTEATHEADQLTTDSFAYGLMARALMAARLGDHQRALELLERLNMRFPAWRENPRREIAKYIPAPAIADRLVADLAALRPLSTN
jgi:tetratricopeptide (TPR) repeat protein